MLNKLRPDILIIKHKANSALGGFAVTGYFGFMRILLIILILLPSFALAQYNLDQQIKDISRIIHLTEEQSHAVEDQLEQLRQEEQTLYKNAMAYRYEATKAYHSLTLLRQSPDKMMFLLPHGDYSDYKYRLSTQKQLQHILTSRINQQADLILSLQDKQAVIEDYERRQELLELTLDSALSDLKTARRNQTPLPQAVKDIINDLVKESASLNEFLIELLDLPTNSYEQDSSPLQFVLPVSGVIESSADQLTINAAPGSIVTAPERGKVVFADAYKRIGKIVIINHGRGYISILRNFDQILVNNGTSVQQGEPIGQLAKKNQDNLGIAPMLYYTLRYNGNNINPITQITGL